MLLAWNFLALSKAKERKGCMERLPEEEMMIHHFVIPRIVATRKQKTCSWSLKSFELSEEKRNKYKELTKTPDIVWPPNDEEQCVHIQWEHSNSEQLKTLERAGHKLASQTDRQTDSAGMERLSKKEKGQEQRHNFRRERAHKVVHGHTWAMVFRAKGCQADWSSKECWTH